MGLRFHLPHPRRALALAVLCAALVPGTWLRSELPPRSYRLDLRFHPVPLPPAAELARHLAPFRLEGAWRMTSGHDWFGSWSALVALPGGRLDTYSDRGYRMTFSPPGSANRWRPLIRPIVGNAIVAKQDRDAESATRDPASGRIWVGWESRNAIQRFAADGSATGLVAPALMQDWGENQGPEAMTRLADGRFVVLREGYDSLWDKTRHRAVLFTGDPVAGARASEFTFVGPRGFKPTDMAQLPDGRVLILLRKVVWPMPPRFAGRIALADPAEIRPGRDWHAQVVARLSSSLPVDNFEGIAIVPRPDGTVWVWLVSDSNQAVSQSNMLWRLSLDSRQVPGSRFRPRPSSPVRASP